VIFAVSNDYFLKQHFPVDSCNDVLCFLSGTDSSLECDCYLDEQKGRETLHLVGRQKQIFGYEGSRQWPLVLLVNVG
jgi:hypothetical protein